MRIKKSINYYIGSVITIAIGAFFISNIALADTYLCNAGNSSSFTTCTGAGYTAHGYENHNFTSYWNSYVLSGHNCTNYVGYMLTINGDPGHGVAMGNAGYWDDTIRANPGWGYTIDSTPAVGSIALWDFANGGTGHVAYVEAIGSNSITISEDNAPIYNSFRWRSVNTTGDWPNKFLHIHDLSSSVPVATLTNRIGALQTNGHYLVKEGSLTAGWSDQLDNVSSGSVGGNRVGVLQTNGHFLVKEGGLGASWVDVLDNVAKGIVTNTRVGVVQTNGHLLVKEGNLGSGWTDIQDNVAQIAMDGNRIGVLQTNGHFLVKEGSLSAGWVDVLDNVSAISVSGNRIGALQTNGHYLVKEGSLTAGWSDQLDNVTQGTLTSNRVGVLQSNGHYLVKEGGLGSSWVDQLDNVQSGTITDNRIAVLQTNGHLLVKEGGLWSSWVDVLDNVGSEALAFF